MYIRNNKMKLSCELAIILMAWIQMACCDSNDNSTICPKGCMNNEDDTIFTCIDSGCQQFPLNFVDDPNYVEHIDVSYNAITAIPVMTYPELTSLDLSYNDLTNIEGTSFEGCPQLTHLNLSGNVITSIIELKLPLLSNLDLSINALSSLQGDSFEDCPEIRTLNLSFNVMKALDRNLFRAGMLAKLEDIDLSHNRITLIEAYTFQFTHALVQLNLSSNSLTDFDDNALYHTNLLVLHLEGNLLNRVNATYFRDLAALQYLSLRRNQIYSVDKDTFQNLRKLERLDMGENHLEDIRENIFHEGLSHPFSELEAVHFDQNRLKTIHANTFSPFPKLEYIFLDDNALAEINPDKPFPTSLKELSMTGNTGLVTIKNGTFSGLNNLNKVDISGCYKLTDIESAAFDEERSTVTDFDASQCGLLHVTKNLLNWTRLSRIVLSGNPWDCDCDLEWAKTGLPLEILKTMQCATPHRLKGQTVEEVDVTEMSCTFYSRHRHGMGIGLIVVATLIFALTAALLIYTYRKRVYLPSSQSRGTYQTLYNAADDTSDPSVSIQVDQSGPETSLLKSTDPAPVSV